MLTLTPHDILTASDDDLDALDPDCAGYCVYRIYDKDATLYIGRATDPFTRLIEHFGRGTRPSGSAFGSFYQRYSDFTPRWAIDIYTIEECEALLQKPCYDASHAERAMIQHFRPCLNKTNNPYSSRLPAHYPFRSPSLDNNAVDYFDF
jgi:hypothetical protein